MKRSDLWLGIVCGVVASIVLVHCTPARAEVEPFASYTHISDILRGCPLACRDEEDALDQIAAGVTLTVGRRRAWEIDLSHGLRTVNYNGWESSTKAEARFYFNRRKKDRQE